MIIITKHIYKGGDIIINEYILVIHGKGEVFRVYSHNERLCITTFLSACDKYSRTENEEYKKHWQELKGLVLEDKYTIIHNEDFIGIRKV